MKISDFNKLKDLLDYCDRQEENTILLLKSSTSMPFLNKRHAQLKIENLNKLRKKVKNQLYGIENTAKNNRVSTQTHNNVITLRDEEDL